MYIKIIISLQKVESKRTIQAQYHTKPKMQPLIVYFSPCQTTRSRVMSPQHYYDKQHTVLMHHNTVWYSTPLRSQLQHLKGPSAYHRQWQPSRLWTGLRSWHRQRRSLSRYPLWMTWRLNMTLRLLLLEFNQIGEDMILDVFTNWFDEDIHDLS